MVLIPLTLLFIISKPNLVSTTCTIENLLADNVEVYYNNEIQNDPTYTVVDNTEVNVICSRAEEYFVNPYANTESDENLLTLYCIGDNIFKKFGDLDNNNQVSFPLTCQAHSTFENYCLVSSIPQGQLIRTQYPFLKAYEKDQFFPAICAEGKILNMNIFLHCDGNDNWIIKINGKVIDRVPNQFCPEQIQPCVSSTDTLNHLISTSSIDFRRSNHDGSYGSVFCITDNIYTISFDALCGNGNFLYVFNSKLIEKTAEEVCESVRNSCDESSFINLFASFEDQEINQKELEGSELNVYCPNDEDKLHGIKIVCEATEWKLTQGDSQISDNFFNYCLKLENVCQNEILTNFNLTLPVGITTDEYSLNGDGLMAMCSLNNTETNVPLVCNEKNWKFQTGANAGGSVNATSLSRICDGIVVNSTTSSTSGATTILRVASSVYLFAVLFVMY